MTDEANPVSLLGLLDQLFEPNEPVPVSMMPQTWGWVLMAVLLLIALSLACLRFWKRYRANTYRRAALRELHAAGNDPVRIAEILRRAAMSAYGRTQVAGLVGADWLRFLDQTIDGSDFTTGPGRAIATAPYAQAQPIDGLKDVATRWIRTHHRDRPT